VVGVKEIEYLKQVFRENPQTGSLIIEVLLEKYGFAFNEWDSSFVKRRDLDPDLLHFLESCSRDIPLKYGVELSFTVYDERDEQREKMIQEGICNYFAYSVFSEESTLRDLARKMLIYVAVSVSFLLLASVLDTFVALNLFTTTLKEGLYIGGWVFLWEAISLLSFNRGKIKQRIAEYKRFLHAPVNFVYSCSLDALASHTEAAAAMEK
jgi:hypothetical protein